jgi:hypothetical protein
VSSVRAGVGDMRLSAYQRHHERDHGKEASGGLHMGDTAPTLSHGTTRDTYPTDSPVSFLCVAVRVMTRRVPT